MPVQQIGIIDQADGRRAARWSCCRSANDTLQADCGVTWPRAADRTRRHRNETPSKRVSPNHEGRPQIDAWRANCSRPGCPRSRIETGSGPLAGVPALFQTPPGGGNSQSLASHRAAERGSAGCGNYHQARPARSWAADGSPILRSRPRLTRIRPGISIHPPIRLQSSRRRTLRPHEVQRWYEELL